MKNAFLKKMLSVVLLTVVLSAALTAAVFWFYGSRVFATLKADELEPRASYISEITAEYMEGYIGIREYERVIKSQHAVWDASLYAYNADGEMFVWPLPKTDAESVSTIAAYLEKVLDGNTVISPMVSQTIGVVVGVPVVSSMGNVIGAIFLVKPIHEVTTAMSSLFVTLLISMLLVSAIMIIPAYIGSRGLTKPLKQMNEAAKAMARGDFSVRAVDKGKDEIAQLGSTLNYLSGELSKTIGDLVFERNRLRAVLDGLGEGIIAVSAEGEIVQYNTAAIRLMGGKSADDIYNIPAYIEAHEDLLAVLKDGANRSREVKHGEAMLKFSMTALENEIGIVTGCVVLIQDITESARLEQTRRDYVANVSHELRTPLASIRGLTDALNDGLIKKDEDKSRYYGYILREAIRLSKLIDDLLELSRLQSGNVAFTKQNMSVDDLIMDVAERYNTIANDKGLKLNVSVEDGCAKAYSNIDRVEQVLIALLDNAIKHTEGGGEILLSVSDCKEKICVKVENPGSISETDITHLFERFYKVDKAHTGSGTGLGLSISKEIMNLLDESINVESENGKVRFFFTLAKSNVKQGKN